MAIYELEQVFAAPEISDESASQIDADFCLTKEGFRDFIFDGTNGSHKTLNFDVVSKIQTHLRGLTDQEPDFYDHTTMLGEYANWYLSALKINPKNLTTSERSAYFMSSLFLSNIEALTALRAFIIDRSWSPDKARSDNHSKIAYLEKRKVYQESVDRFYDHFNGELPTAIKDETLQDTANLARLLIARRDWVSALTTTNNHEFVGSVLSERAVKEAFRNQGYPEARYGTPEEDVSPIKADVVVPLGRSALHLQVKMRINPAEFTVFPDRSPMGVVVPMEVLRSSLTKPEKRMLLREAAQKIGQIAA